MLRPIQISQPLLSVDVEPPGSERYVSKIAAGRAEILSALRLRYDVFHRELRCGEPNADGIDLDVFDMRSLHLIVVDRISGDTVGTYRLGNLPRVAKLSGLYCSGEFDTSCLPQAVVDGGIEVGRACIARSHRNSRVLLKLWQGLLKVMRSTGRQYLFGCSSIFTRDVAVGKATFEWLVARGHVETNYSVKPANSSVAIDLNVADDANVVVPPLLDMYLRCGARICSPPIYDSAFGTVDMLIVFDINAMSDRQRRLFERG